MREYSREGHHVAYESEVKLEPSQWHEGSFAVEIVLHEISRIS